jgi:hypothetical protein
MTISRCSAIQRLSRQYCSCVVCVSWNCSRVPKKGLHLCIFLCDIFFCVVDYHHVVYNSIVKDCVIELKFSRLLFENFLAGMQIDAIQSAGKN